TSFLQPQRIRGTDGSGRAVLHFRHRKRNLLVRYGHVAACKTLLLKRDDEIAHLFRRHGFPRVCALDTIPLEPVPMNERRARLLDRPADDTRTFHDATTPLLRSSFRS